MEGLTIIQDGIAYPVPAEVEAKGDKKVAAWVEAAAARDPRRGGTRTRKGQRPTEPDAVEPPQEG